MNILKLDNDIYRGIYIYKQYNITYSKTTNYTSAKSIIQLTFKLIVNLHFKLASCCYYNICTSLINTNQYHVHTTIYFNNMI